MIAAAWTHPIPVLRAELRERVHALAEFRPLHEAAACRLLDWTHRNVRARGALLEDDPSGWPPLAAATLRDRRRRGLGTEPLVATGRMQRGFTMQADAAAARVANPVPYARRHQEGDGVPRRAIFPQPGQAARIVFPEVLRHVQGALE